MQKFQSTNYLGINMPALMTKEPKKVLSTGKKANWLSKFLQWLAKGYEGRPACVS